MGGFSRKLAVSLSALGIVLAQAVPQARTAGRVVRLVSGDTIPVAQAAVVLHRVGRTVQGPIDTVRADAHGRFAFRFLPDSTAAYLLSVRYQGIEYFSSPVTPAPGRADTAIVLIVADTSSAAPVRARERTLLISRADESGTRPVVDWFVLQNGGERTRIAPDSARPSWGAPLPPDAQNVELADAKLSQFSPEALEFRGDSVLVFAPLSPGRKELVLQYHIPGSLRDFVVPAAGGTDSVFVLLEEPSARVIQPALLASGSQRLDGRPFRRWAGVMGQAAQLTIRFAAPPPSARTMLKLLVALTGLGFALLGLWVLRRPRLAPAAHSSDSPAFLADAIARLDAAQLERDGASSPEQDAQYHSERARLKEALVRTLAALSRRS